MAILDFASCDFRSDFLKVYPHYFHSHTTQVHECKFCPMACLSVSTDRYIVEFGLVEMTISTNPKATIYRNFYGNKGPGRYLQN